MNVYDIVQSALDLAVMKKNNSLFFDSLVNSGVFQSDQKQEVHDVLAKIVESKNVELAVACRMMKAKELQADIFSVLEISKQKADFINENLMKENALAYPILKNLSELYILLQTTLLESLRKTKELMFEENKNT